MSNNSNRELKEYYDKFYRESEFQYYDVKTTQRFLDAVLGKCRVTTGSRILDIGCGTGFYTELLHGAGYDSMGIDISRVGLLKGRETHLELQLVAGDASSMPFIRGSFDVLFMNGCSLANTHDIDSIQTLYFIPHQISQRPWCPYISGTKRLFWQIRSERELDLSFIR